MKLYIVRHAETNENVNLKLMGRSPGKLSNFGKEQARTTGVALKEEGIEHVYTSPLQRCVETTNLINESLSLEVHASELLTERDFGALTNNTHGDIDFNALDTPSEENTRMGVEPLVAVQDRLVKFLDEIMIKHQNQNVLIVSHNNPIRMLFAILLKTTYEDILGKYKVHNCGISVVDYSLENQPVFIKMDDINHLGGQ